MGIFDIFKRKEMDMQTTVQAPRNEVEQTTSVVQNTVPADITNDFVMDVEDVFYITGRGTVVTGRVLRGRININDMVIIKETGVSTTVTGIEKFRSSLDYAEEGDVAGVLLGEISREEISRGMHLVK